MNETPDTPRRSPRKSSGTHPVALSGPSPETVREIQSVINSSPSGQAPSNSEAQVAASFSPLTAGMMPAMYSYGGRVALIDNQKMRNNWLKKDIRAQMSACRRYAETNWFVEGVLGLRQAAQSEGFAVQGLKSDVYDLDSLMTDLFWEDLITENIVCLWRRGVSLPMISVLDSERVTYRSVAGVERITINCEADAVMARDKSCREDYIAALGERMYNATCQGRPLTIVTGDPDWAFEVLPKGKRRGLFSSPSLVSILEDLDFLELMRVGDWNLAWSRKDVIRMIHKGYAVTQGNTAGLNSVDITTENIAELGAGFSKVNGSANIPANHDVKVSYLTVPAENFRPDQVESAIDRIMTWGGAEAAALFGSFSQQNGAAPMMMRNARASAFDRRKRLWKFLLKILSNPEFAAIRNEDLSTLRPQWGVKLLYSVDELKTLVTSTADGVLSTRTRREILGYDSDEETARLKVEHADRPGYAPPFEARQGLLPALFPDELGKADVPAADAPGEPGRPGDAAPA